MFVHTIIRTLDNDTIECWESLREDSRKIQGIKDIFIESSHSSKFEKSMAARSSKSSPICDAKSKRAGHRSKSRLTLLALIRGLSARYTMETTHYACVANFEIFRLNKGTDKCVNQELVTITYCLGRDHSTAACPLQKRHYQGKHNMLLYVGFIKSRNSQATSHQIATQRAAIHDIM
jgi:hypothetical protein